MFNKLFPLLFQIFESCVFHVICKEFFHLIIFRRSLYSIICIWNYFFIFDKKKFKFFMPSYMFPMRSPHQLMTQCSQCKMFPYKCFHTLGTYSTYEVPFICMHFNTRAICTQLTLSFHSQYELSVFLNLPNVLNDFPIDITNVHTPT